MKNNSGAINALLKILATYLATALGTAAVAGDIGYMQLSFSSDAGSGEGYVRYDPATLNPYYAYRDALMACNESGDFGPCRHLPSQLGFPLLIMDAQLRMPGTAFDTGNFSWNFHVDGDCFFENCGRDTASVSIDNGTDFIWYECSSGAGSPIIRDAGLFANCGSFEFLEYYVNGIRGDDSNGRFTFREVPMPAPEPGTLALFGIGLAGLGLSRRRKA